MIHRLILLFVPATCIGSFSLYFSVDKTLPTNDFVNVALCLRQTFNTTVFGKHYPLIWTNTPYSIQWMQKLDVHSNSNQEWASQLRGLNRFDWFELVWISCSLVEYIRVKREVTLTICATFTTPSLQNLGGTTFIFTLVFAQIVDIPLPTLSTPTLW